MANFFDQFDQQAGPNYFDRFDASGPPEQPSSSVGDFFKSIPRGIVSGIASATSGPVAPESPVPMNPVEMMSAQDRVKGFESGVTGPMYQPQGRAGKFGAAIGEGLGNPLSYVGPGSLPLKLGASVLGSTLSEGAGQATEGTPFETPARILGGLAGGVAGAKALGPAAEKAAIPTAQELKDAATAGYTAARNSGIVVDPSKIASFASKAQQELSGPDYGFSPKVAGKTFAVLDELQNAPPGAKLTASNLDALRQNLGHIANETQPALGGFARPTPDAAAASILSDRLKSYLSNIPQNHLLAGKAEDYVRPLAEANGNYAAAKRLENVDARLSKAENLVDRQVAGSLESQIKSKVGSLLDNPERMRGLTQAEKDQIQLINSGSLVSNTLRQAGRLSPRLGTQGVIAAATGGASIPLQAATLPFYFARKGSEAMTKARAEKLAQMLAMRSPLYNQRLANTPAFDSSPNIAAMLRGGLMGAMR